MAGERAKPGKKSRKVKVAGPMIAIDSFWWFCEPYVVEEKNSRKGHKHKVLRLGAKVAPRSG